MSYNFTDTTRIKRMLGVTNAVCAGTTMYDPVIQDIQSAVEIMMIDELCIGDQVGVQTYSETIDIDFAGQGEIAVRYRPIVSVVALTIGGQLQTLNSGVSTDGEYTLVKELGVVKLNPLYMSFPTGRGVIQITYTAGMTTIPEDLKYASNMIAVSMFNQQGHIGFRSESAGGYRYSMDGGEGSTIPKIAQRIINKHRRLFARGAIYNDT